MVERSRPRWSAMWLGMVPLACISRAMRFSSGVIRAVGGMAGTPVTRATTPDGTQELRLTLEPQHTHNTRIKKFKEIRDG